MFQKYGSLALLAGLAVAVIVGLLPGLDTGWVQAALLVLGLIGGALNVKSDKSGDFLVAGIALMLAAGVRGELARMTSVGDAIELILKNVYLVVAAASLVLAVKTIVIAAVTSKK